MDVLAAGATKEAGVGTTGARWWLPVAAMLHLGIGIFPVSMTGLLAPPAGVAGAALLWAGGAGWLWWSRRRGALALAGPFGTLALWVAMVAFGDAVLGWTA